MTGWLSPSGVLTACEPLDADRTAARIAGMPEEQACDFLARAGWVLVDHDSLSLINPQSDEQRAWLRAETKRRREEVAGRRR